MYYLGLQLIAVGSTVLAFSWNAIMHHVNCIVAITSILFADWLAKWSGKHYCRAGRKKTHTIWGEILWEGLWRGAWIRLGREESLGFPDCQRRSLHLTCAPATSITFAIWVSVFGFGFGFWVLWSRNWCRFFLSWFLCKMLANRHAFWQKEKIKY